MALPTDQKAGGSTPSRRAEHLGWSEDPGGFLHANLSRQIPREKTIPVLQSHL